MRFKTLSDVEWAGYTGECGPLYRIDTVVFNTYIGDDGATHFDDAYFWEECDESNIHWFDCFFTDLEEARLYCKVFDDRVAKWSFTHGTGKFFDHVAVEITVMEWEGGMWIPSHAISTYDWMWGTKLEAWHDFDISEERACRV